MPRNSELRIGRILTIAACISLSMLFVGCEFDPLGIEKLRKESQRLA